MWVSVSVQGRYNPASWWHYRGVFPSPDTRRLAAENGVRQPLIELAVSVVGEIIMPLTRSFKEIIQARAWRDGAFRQALLADVRPTGQPASEESV
jgi:hypothetical protein